MARRGWHIIEKKAADDRYTMGYGDKKDRYRKPKEQFY